MLMRMKEQRSCSMEKGNAFGFVTQGWSATSEVKKILTPECVCMEMLL